MTIKCKKLIASLCLFLSVVSACGELVAAKSSPQLPLRTIAVSVERSGRDAFFDQLKKFADKHAFAIRVAPVRPDGEHFIIQMWREDLKAIGTNSFETPAFEISVYANDEHLVPEEQLDALISDLKLFVGEVQGVTFPPPAKKP